MSAAFGRPFGQMAVIFSAASRAGLRTASSGDHLGEPSVELGRPFS
jgi:hypothetical protein